MRMKSVVKKRRRSDIEGRSLIRDIRKASKKAGERSFSSILLVDQSTAETQLERRGVSSRIS
jgi:hypothetical protein